MDEYLEVKAEIKGLIESLYEAAIAHAENPLCNDEEEFYSLLQEVVQEEIDSWVGK